MRSANSFILGINVSTLSLPEPPLLLKQKWHNDFVLTHEYESSWTYALHLSHTVRHTPPSCRSLILYVYAQKNMANYIWKGWCKAKCNSFIHSFTWTLAIPKLLHKDKMKFTFSPFQGLSSCQNLLFFTLYLSQN